jgi:prevent-host-death family protein
MTTVTIHQAKTNLSKLIAKALAGEEVVVAKGKEPVVRLVPIKPLTRKRKLGWLAHQMPSGKDIIGPAFWEDLSDEEAGLASEIFPKS